ncbi:MAG: sugar phosphate isomerase/epimerase family protein [Faecousia sp.]
MKKEAFLISTIAEDAVQTAMQYGLGLEIAEFCTASNLDERFLETDAAVRAKMAQLPCRVLHGPFNELFPCAIDPKARELARLRYRQALKAAQSYGISTLVLHAGFNPHLYFPCWFTEQSILFWRDFVHEIPDGMTVCLENVLEETPELLTAIVRTVESPKLRLCLDVGHISAYSSVPALQWLESCAPHIAHFHIHNNDGSRDAHDALFAGRLDMKQFLRSAERLCPNATFTLELLTAEPSVLWLAENGILEEEESP